MMTKHEVVLSLHPTQKSEEFTYFSAFEPNFPDEQTDGYYMPVSHWREMCYPEQITITVQPGDTLNQDLSPYCIICSPMHKGLPHLHHETNEHDSWLYRQQQIAQEGKG